MHIVYVLRSEKDGNLYIGCTGNLEKRIALHEKGMIKATKGRIPLQLIYSESYEDKYEAYRMERWYKTPKGKRALKTKF